MRNKTETLSNELDESLVTEGLDDELLRQLTRLLDIDIERKQTSRNVTASAMRQARLHLTIARLCFEAGLSDQAEAEAREALSIVADDDDAMTLLAAIFHQRGELGEAIRLHTLVALRKTGESSALAELGRIFEASLRAESPPSRPNTISPDTPAPAAGMADLEHAFRLSFTGNLQQALRIVDRVAMRARTETWPLYKLAMLERAFLLEQAHDVRGAITTLERLADEPGLANDVERLLCLSMLYEREGTMERFRRALRAVRYAYLVTRKPTLLRRISRLLGKLGHARLADQFEARYLEVFRKRMHALSLRQTASALRFVYVPPEGLARLTFGKRSILHLASRHHGRKRVEHMRQAAVLSLWAGEATQAVALYRKLDAEGQTSHVDLLYFADALEVLGEQTNATKLRRRAIAGLDKPNATSLVRLYGRTNSGVDDDDSPSLQTPERLDQAARTLQSRHLAMPDDVATLMALSKIANELGHSHDAAMHETHAKQIEIHGAAPGHLVLAAAAFRRGGDVRGIIHELWVDSRRVGKGRGGLDADDVLGSVAPELRTKTVAIFHAVRAFVRARYPHRVVHDVDDKRYFLRMTKDDEPSSGDSAGLAIAVALASVMLGISAPRDVAFSGALICDAHHVLTIGRIGDVDAKIEGAYERRMRKIVLPSDNRHDVELAERIPRKIADTTVLFVRTLDDVLAMMLRTATTGTPHTTRA